MVVEGQVMTAGDEAQKLTLRTSPGPAFDIAPDMETDASPVRNAEQGNLDVSHVVFLRGVVRLIAEFVGRIVPWLVLSVRGQFFL